MSPSQDSDEEQDFEDQLLYLASRGKHTIEIFSIITSDLQVYYTLQKLFQYSLAHTETIWEAQSAAGNPLTIGYYCLQYFSCILTSQIVSACG